FFFFQAEDGIRDKLVTGFRRVLFRSPGVRASGTGGVLAAEKLEHLAARRREQRAHRGFIVPAQPIGPGKLGRFGEVDVLPSEVRSEERRVGKESRHRWDRQRLRKKSS